MDLLRVDGLTIAPIMVWGLMHVAHPNSDDRVYQYGLRAADATSDWRRLILHALIHGNDAHLLQNCCAHFIFASSLHLPAAFRRWRISRTALGLFLMAGGALFGIWATLADADRRTAEFRERYGFGIGILQSVVGYVHSTLSQMRLFCGGSAAIAALAGFNAGNARHPIEVLMGFMPIGGDVMALIRQENVMLSFSLGAPIVAHAAHIGGFAFGFGVALFAKLLDRVQGPPRFTGGGRPTGGGRRLGPE